MASASAGLPKVEQPPSPGDESILGALEEALLTTPSRNPSGMVPVSAGDMTDSPMVEGDVPAPLPQQIAPHGSASSQGGPQTVAGRVPADAGPQGSSVRNKTRTPSTIGGMARNPQETRRSHSREGHGSTVQRDSSFRRWNNPAPAAATVASGARGRPERVYPQPLPMWTVDPTLVDSNLIQQALAIAARRPQEDHLSRGPVQVVQQNVQVVVNAQSVPIPQTSQSASAHQESAMVFAIISEERTQFQIAADRMMREEQAVMLSASQHVSAMQQRVREVTHP